MIEMIKCTFDNETQLDAVELLAKVIWHEHYTPIIGKAQVEYMLEKFQSKSVMRKQIEEGFLYYLISNNGKNAGYIGLSLNSDHVFLSKIYVKSDCRGQGLGKSAMQFVERMAAENSLSKIVLTVNKYNTNSIEAYKKFGFSIAEAIVMDIGNGYVMDDYRMEKQVSAHVAI